MKLLQMTCDFIPNIHLSNYQNILEASLLAVLPSLPLASTSILQILEACLLQTTLAQVNHDAVNTSSRFEYLTKFFFFFILTPFLFYGSSAAENLDFAKIFPSFFLFSFLLFISRGLFAEVHRNTQASSVFPPDGTRVSQVRSRKKHNRHSDLYLYLYLCFFP